MQYIKVTDKDTLYIGFTNSVLHHRVDNCCILIHDYNPIRYMLPRDNHCNHCNHCNPSAKGELQHRNKVHGNQHELQCKQVANALLSILDKLLLRDAEARLHGRNLLMVISLIKFEFIKLYTLRETLCQLCYSVFQCSFIPRVWI